MSKIYFEDKTFKGVDFSDQALAKGEYENCTFIQCLFSNTDLLNTNFSECQFEECNLSMAKIANTAFKNVHFKQCKMVGLYFEHCNKFMLSLSFDSCVLNLSSFYKLNLKNTRFQNTVLHEVDFTEADLTSSIFDRCDLFKTVFDKSVLEKVDFRTAYNYAFDIENNRIKKAKFSANGIAGLLKKYDIEIS
ncbi:MAG: pentapeptide repeat-containing protein [Saprospiraceae bacterium]|nr:pentapeptide repeat-containing protein [Saprospiraceae bacterium]